MALNWTVPINLTSSLFSDSFSRVAFAPDRSVYVLFNRTPSPNNALYLLKRNRAGLWLDLQRVDNLAADSVQVDPNVNAPHGAGGEPGLQVDAAGNVHIVWIQKGFGSSPLQYSAVYRKFAFDGVNDYGTPQDKIVVANRSVAVQTVSMAVDPNDETVWFSFSADSDTLYSTYKLEGDTPGTELDTNRIDSFFTNPVSHTVRHSEHGLWVDKQSAVHAAWILTGDDEINYTYRLAGDPKTSTENPFTKNFRAAELAVPALASALENRFKISLFARGLGDVSFQFQLNLTTSDECWLARRSQIGGEWTLTRVDDTGVSNNAEAGHVLGTPSEGSLLSVHVVNGDPNSGLYYGTIVDDTLEVNLAFGFTVAGGRSASFEHGAARLYPRTPRDLGYFNTRIGEAVVVYSKGT